MINGRRELERTEKEKRREKVKAGESITSCTVLATKKNPQYPAEIAE